MRPFAALALCFAALLAPLPLRAQAPVPVTGRMPSAVESLLAADPSSARAHWGISIVDAATGAVLYARNDAQLFAPASNAKLFTTSAALALLGPTYTMGTRVLAQGTIDAGGTLHGELRLIGGGDPSISGRVYPYAGHTERSNPPLGAFDALAAQVLASGIHAVDGPVTADDTLFPDERYGTGWNWDDLLWEYGAPVSALPVNDNVLYLTVTPGNAPGASLEASWLPEVTDRSAFGGPIGEEMDAVTAPAGSPPALGVAQGSRAMPFRLYGSLPLGGAPVHLALAQPDPTSFAAEAFVHALSSAGFGIGRYPDVAHRPSNDTQSFTAETHAPVALHALPPGSSSLPVQTGPAVIGAGVQTTGTVPTGFANCASVEGAPPHVPCTSVRDVDPLVAMASPTARIVATRESPPLADLATVINKVSQNLHAELLLRLLGRAEGSDGSFAQGARVVRAWATTQAGLAPDDFVLYDGSGLSTKDLVTPRALTKLLRYSNTQPWGSILRNSLPIGGVDGSLSARFPALRGRVQAKTGTLGEVDALSGFLTANSGRSVVFSILCNDHPGPGARALIDAVVVAAAQNF